MSYNILGDKNAFKHRDLYQNVRYEYMKWNRRKRLICQELIGLNPDIICMQEVDRYFDILNVMEKADMLVVTSGALGITSMVVGCFGKLISFGY